MPRSKVKSPMIPMARKTLPCHRNHLSPRPPPSLTAATTPLLTAGRGGHHHGSVVIMVAELRLPLGAVRLHDRAQSPPRVLHRGASFEGERLQLVDIAIVPVLADMARLAKRSASPRVGRSCATRRRGRLCAQQGAWRRVAPSCSLPLTAPGATGSHPQKRQRRSMAGRVGRAGKLSSVRCRAPAPPGPQAWYRERPTTLPGAGQRGRRALGGWASLPRSC